MDGKHRILKLYRHSMKPKEDVLRHVTEVSLRNRESLVTCALSYALRRGICCHGIRKARFTILDIWREYRSGP